MKKITIFLVAIMASSILFQAGAQTTISSDAQGLLDQLRNLPTTSQTVRQTIVKNFNESEQTILFNYFANEVANRPPSPSRSLANDVYAFDIQSFDLGTFPLAGPYSIDVLSSPENLFLADDFDADGNWYAIGGFNGELQLLSVSTVDGSFTGIGPLAVPAGIPSGLSYNPVNETWYMIHNNGNTNRSQLYSVNISTGAITLINADTGMSQGIWLEIDNNGIAYSLDIVDDQLYTVDLQTGVATVVGPFGVDLKNAQEAFIDQETNILYAAAYTANGTSAIYSIDVTTGAGTLLDTTPAELTMASMYNINNGGGASCSQSIPSNSFEDGIGDLTNGAEVADDLLVAADEDFIADQLTVNIWHNGGGFNDVVVGFYRDNAGFPLEQVGNSRQWCPRPLRSSGRSLVLMFLK